MTGVLNLEYFHKENEILDKLYKSKQICITKYLNNNSDLLYKVCISKYNVYYVDWKYETSEWKSEYDNKRIIELEGALKGLCEIFDIYFNEQGIEHI